MSDQWIGIPGRGGGPLARPGKPLFGLTILLVEDSRSASEALRLFAAESGARLRRADSIAAAERHLAVFRPNAVIVDLGLPDGDGLRLIRTLARAPVPYQAIVATSGAERNIWEAAALEAGAAACLDKPVPGLRAFQDCLLAILPVREGAAVAADDLDPATTASVRAALEDDLHRALALLEAAVASGDGQAVTYGAQFLSSLGVGGAEAASLADAAPDDPGTMLGAAGLIAKLRHRLDAGSGPLRGVA